MKKVLVVLMMLSLFASLSSAQLLIGSRAGGMGGAGVASVTDLAAAYYNPAALMQSKVALAEAKVSLGAEYTDPTELADAIGNSSDPASFIANNYGKALSFSGNVDGVVGFNIAKIGLSVLPVANVTVNKTANSMIGTVTGNGKYYTTLTIGRTIRVPFLPASLDVGINAKNVTAYMGNIATTGTALTAAGTSTYGTGTGWGFDVGVLTSVKIPLLSTIKVGAVARNFGGESVTYSRKSKTNTLDYSTGTAVVTEGPEVSLADLTIDTAPSYAVGAAVTVPGINLLIAGDIETTSNGGATHFGIEVPILFNTIILRAGVASGNNLAKTTLGAKVDLFLLTLDGVVVSDANNQGATAYIIDINIGL